MKISSHKTDLQFLLLLVILSGLYIFWTWNHELAGLNGDNAIYLLTAKYFSPWTPPSQVAHYFAGHSQYPPFYPIVLALFGGGQSILAAHLITTGCLILALAALRTWLLSNNLDNRTANFVVMLFALLPGTVKMSMFIMSENLYLFLSMLALALVSLSDERDNSLLLISCAIVIAATTLTRTVGISMTAAFCLYLIIKRPKRSFLCVFISIAPFVSYAVFQRLQAVEHSSYWDALIKHYHTDTAAKILEQIRQQSIYLWHGWQANFEAGPATVIIGLFFILCIVSLFIRIFTCKLDGLYLLFYFIIFFLWPYPDEAKRLIYAILPVLIGQGIFLLSYLPLIPLSKNSIKPVSLFMLVILIISLPSTAALAHRFLQPLPTELEPYRRTKFLYSSGYDNAYRNLINGSILIVDLKSLDAKLPPDAIIYAIKPSIISFYTNRLTLAPPGKITPDLLQLSGNKNQPIYFYMIGITSPSIPTPYYPLEKVINHIEILHVAKTFDSDDAPVIAILARLQQ